jgi:hypothetical protein
MVGRSNLLKMLGPQKGDGYFEYSLSCLCFLVVASIL